MLKSFCRSFEKDAVSQTFRATEFRWFHKSLDQHSAIRFDYSLRCDVCWVRGYFNKLQTLSLHLRQEQSERERGITSSALPWDHRISDVAEAVWWKSGCERLPAETNLSAKFAIP
jgi:hypothetical protein